MGGQQHPRIDDVHVDVSRADDHASGGPEESDHKAVEDRPVAVPNTIH